MLTYIFGVIIIAFFVFVICRPIFFTVAIIMTTMTVTAFSLLREAIRLVVAIIEHILMWIRSSFSLK